MKTTWDSCQVRDDVDRALKEDLGAGDLSAHLVPETLCAKAVVRCREAALICGYPWFSQCFIALDPRVRIQYLVAEGEKAAAGQDIVIIEGKARALLSAERSALNFLQTLSATATTTRLYVDLLSANSGTTRLLDTRKTLPGLRQAQKYAVRVGGGYNHRMGLYDAFLIKENHIRAAGSIAAAVAAARSVAGQWLVEVEVENLDELDQALAAGVDRIMLDELTADDLPIAIERCRGRVETELSGGVELAQLPALGALGVDYISVGALTKHVRAIDLSMRITCTTGDT